MNSKRLGISPNLRRSTASRWTIIGQNARGLLRYGDLHVGFARVRFPDCQYEMLVLFTCAGIGSLVARVGGALLSRVADLSLRAAVNHPAVRNGS